MKPYLAIIIDSLREALASRVLWVLVIGITIVLLALAPLSYRTDLTTEFLSNRDFYAPQKLALKLRGKRLQASPARAIWEAMNDGQQTTISELASNKDDLFSKTGGMRRALNTVVRSETPLHNEKDWDGERILPEAQELLQKAGDEEGAEALTETERARLNRLLIEGAFPENFLARPDKTVTLTYAMLDFPRTPLSEDRLQTLIKDLVLPMFTNLLLGVVAVLIALLVTSTIIPEMFSPGTLHLLLSKPLSRSLIFLSRFFGGCFFVLINITYLLVGLWIILGARFGIWNAGLLKCIPLFLFLFLVYYSVAALAGAYWKNAIVAVAVAAGLWGVCFVIGFTKEIMKDFVRAGSLRRMVVNEDLLLGVSENDEVSIWSDEDGDWTQVFEEGKPLHGPILTESADLFVATSGGGRGPRFARRGSQVTITAGRADSGWSRESIANAPEGTGGLMLDQNNNLFVLARDGVHRFKKGLVEKQRGLFGFQIPLPAMAALAWKKVAQPTEGEAWKQPMDSDIHPTDDTLVVYTRGRVIRFEKQADKDQPYRETHSRDLADETGLDIESGVMVQWYGDQVAIAIGDGNVITLDGKSLEVKRQERPSRLSQPKLITTSPDGKHLAVLMKNGNVLLSKDGTELERCRAPDATAVALTNDQLYVGANDRSVTSIDLKSKVQTVKAKPPLDNLQRIYRWIVQPLSTILPMPGELGNTARYLMSGKETTDSGLFQGTLDAPYKKIDPWTPVIRCSIFVLFVLSLGCWYIERQEF